MKNIVKLATLILSIICISIVPTMANEIEFSQPYPFYFSFTGTVKEIEKIDDNITKVFLEGEDGSSAHFMLNENTYYADNVKIEKGLNITGYYEAGKPMILIYPPQYTIDIVTPVYEEGFIKADKFDSNLVSKDNKLKLNISEETEIVWENNTQINWIKQPTLEELETVLSNRQMLVYYKFSTKSIPAQTTPSKIIVLSPQKEDKMNIIANNILIDSPNAFISELGNVMVPVRAISEALGYEVKWNNDEKSVRIGNDISFKLGENIYTASGVAVTLEEASIIIDGRTFIPLRLFENIADIKTDNLFEVNIFINTKTELSE